MLIYLSGGREYIPIIFGAGADDASACQVPLCRYSGYILITRWLISAFCFLPAHDTSHATGIDSPASYCSCAGTRCDALKLMSCRAIRRFIYFIKPALLPRFLSLKYRVGQNNAARQYFISV